MTRARSPAGPRDPGLSLGPSPIPRPFSRRARVRQRRLSRASRGISCLGSSSSKRSTSGPRCSTRRLPAKWASEWTRSNTSDGLPAGRGPGRERYPRLLAAKRHLHRSALHRHAGKGQGDPPSVEAGIRSGRCRRGRASGHSAPSSAPSEHRLKFAGLARDDPGNAARHTLTCTCR